MSDKLRPSQYADAKGVISESFEANVGLINEGTAVPADTTPGYAAGALFFKRSGAAGAQLYINEGTKLSCLFKALGSQAATAIAVTAVAGVAAGYKLARGQAAAITGSGTVVTGLALVVAAVANMDDDPVVDPEFATATIGDQAGTPAAGSIILKTWKTLGGTPAAGTVAKKVNWIAIGT